MIINKIKGLKYPDEYFVKFFFKNKLHQMCNIKVLEFGCGNGNNLMLPLEYSGIDDKLEVEGREKTEVVVGVDNDPLSIQYAYDNFNLTQKINNKFSFVVDDMRLFAKNKADIQADVFVLASAAYYISREDLQLLFTDMIQNNNVKNKIPFYIRVRSKKDFRYGYGKKIAQSRFKMPEESITGENGAKIEFYSEDEIVNILKDTLNLKDYHVMTSEAQNEQNGMIVFNSDIIIWGMIN